MDAQFWINAWNEGRTGFHQEKYNPKLLEFFPGFHPEEGQKVLVPLCGKTKDILWLHENKLHVHGVELHQKAVESFFKENHLSPVVKTDENFIHYSNENIVISSGDFFKLNNESKYDFIYDRASLVALPQSMRDEYVAVVTRTLKSKGKYLLIVYEYDQNEMQGPPFSIDNHEVHRLYQNDFSITLRRSDELHNENSRLSAVKGIRENVYLLEKK